MLKFAIILVLICVLWRWISGTWPWTMLAGPQSKEQKLVEARKVLGVKRFSSREDIVSAHKRVIAKVHPDRGGSNDAVHEANDARDLLLGELPASDLERKEGDPPSE